MERMKFETPDMVAGNVEKIGALFPNCVTEALDEEKSTPEHKVYKKAVNFELLKQMLSPEALAGDEAYEFTWVGKKAAIVEANKPIRATLRPCPEESVNWDTTENLYIEGDNLQVLKLLQESYLGKVKLIYIDPPYNTGNDFIYRDNFTADSEEYQQEQGLFDEDENRLFHNTDSNGRFHSDWCTMMYSRLMLARNLLSIDGAIFISIDDNECTNLINLCNEVFGESCFIADISYQRTYAPRNDSKGISKEIEHIVAFSKQAEWNPKKLPRTAEMNAKYGNPDGDDTLWRADNPCGPGAATHQGMVYAIQHPFTGRMLYPSNNACWRYQQSEMLRIMSGWGNYGLKNLHDEKERAIICGVSEDSVRSDVFGIVLMDDLDAARKHAQEVYDKGKWPIYYFTSGGTGGIAKKTYLKEENGKVVTNFWPHVEVGHTDEAKKELITLFDGKAPFDTPKPVRLMDRILAIASDKDSIVLDFFSGSASMAHAVLQKNAKDNGHRKFIMVQIPEKSYSPDYSTLCDIGKERIRRAGRKIQEEAPLTTQDLDIGFRVLKLDSSNMKDVYYAPGEVSQAGLLDMVSNIKEDRSALDLLFGCLLEWNLPLSLPYRSESIDGCTVHTYNDGDLIACFDKDIPDSVIREIARRKPLRAVFRDDSFADSPAKINVFELFKLLAPDARVKVI